MNTYPVLQEQGQNETNEIINLLFQFNGVESQTQAGVL